MNMKRLLLALLVVVPTLGNSLAYARQSDLWVELSRSFKLKDQSTQPEVKQQIKWLLMHPDYMAAFAKNSKPYIYFILEEIKRQNLPGELALMPMIESNYNPFAYSHAGAAGLWQLMPGTGSGLGVKQNWWYDGRRGVISSTNAALDYLKYLNNFFKGDWLHAIAAYDSGEGTVRRSINRNLASNKATHFWALGLPKETQAYVPRLFALISIIKYPRYFGATLPPQTYEPYFAEVPITSQIDLNHAAKLAEVPYDEILKLNPGHNRWTTAPNKHNNTLLVPINSVDTFLANLEQAPKSSHQANWIRHIVKSGESLSVIAQKYRSAVTSIIQINQLKNAQIKIGQQLLIPQTPLHLTPNVVSEAQKRMAINHSLKVGPHKQVIHIVQKGETLQSISQKYHVKPAEIVFWNQLKSNSLNNSAKLLIWQKKLIYRGKNYIVKAGDTLSGIAHKLNISLSKIKSLNPWLKKNDAVIKPKQNIRTA